MDSFDPYYQQSDSKALLDEAEGIADQIETYRGRLAGLDPAPLAEFFELVANAVSGVGGERLSQLVLQHGNG